MDKSENKLTMNENNFYMKQAHRNLVFIMDLKKVRIHNVKHQNKLA